LLTPIAFRRCSISADPRYTKEYCDRAKVEITIKTIGMVGRSKEERKRPVTIWAKMMPFKGESKNGIGFTGGFWSQGAFESVG
jgi:hypothetical protein